MGHIYLCQNEQIIVFNLCNAVPAILTEGDSNAKRKKQLEFCPEEWNDDFGAEFYEHVLDNDFYYLSPNSSWQADAISIPAPGILQFELPSEQDLQISIEELKEETETQNG